MKPTSPETPLIEVIESGHPDYTGKAKFKGKLLHPEVISMCDHECLEVAMPAEYLFDFKAGELPEDMDFGVLLSQGECLGLLQSVSLYREARHVEMKFHFELGDYIPPHGELNPYKTMPLLIASLKRQNYTVKAYEDDSPIIYSVKFKVPFKDNVYPHYVKHLAAFEKVCLPIEMDMVKTLNKKLKKKLAEMGKANKD